jgi:hypothetical protein
MVDETAGRVEQDAVRRLLDRTLTETMDRLGSHAGGIHLVEPGGEIVSIEVCVGVPPEFSRRDRASDRARTSASLPACRAPRSGG